MEEPSMHLCRERGLFALVAAALVGGCVNLSPDAGFKDVERIAARRIEQRLQWNRNADDEKAAADLTRELLAQPLTAEGAVQVALLNNRGLQASYGDLGVAQAEVVRAGRAANPSFSAHKWTAGEAFKSEIGIEFDFLSLLLIPLKLEAQRANFEYTKLRLGGEILALARDVRAQYYRTLAASQEVAMEEAITRSAEAAAELAERQQRVGNLSAKNRAKHQLVHAEAASRLAQLRRRAFSEREQLARLLGLAKTSWTLPERLPEVPASLPAFGDLEELALEQRLDVQAARQSVEVAARDLGLTNVTRLVDSLMLGWGNLNENGEARKRGPSIAFELPLFDQGGSRVYRDTTRLRQAEERLAEVVIHARSEAREKYNELLAAHEQVARAQRVIVPLRRSVLAQTQLAYNGMLEGIYELLDSYRENAAAGQMAIDAVKEYWIVLAELEHAVGGKLPAFPPAEPRSPAADSRSGIGAPRHGR